MFDPFIGSALISGGAHLIGGIFGSKSTENVNKAQIQLAHEQMDWSENMMDKQNQWNLDQWNRQNAYNTPSAQRQRLEDAGLNPLHYGLDGTGNAGSMTSVSPNAVSMPVLQNPGLSIQAALTNIGNVAADTQLKKAQANELNSRAGLNDAEMQTVNGLRDGLIRKGNFEADVSQAAAKYADELTAAQIRQINASVSKLSKETEQLDDYLQLAKLAADNDRMRVAIEQSHLDNETKKIANDFLIASRRLAMDEKLNSVVVQIKGYELEIIKTDAKYHDEKVSYQVEQELNQANITAAAADEAYRTGRQSAYYFKLWNKNSKKGYVQFIDSGADVISRQLAPINGVLGTAVSVSKLAK